MMILILTGGNSIKNNMNSDIHFRVSLNYRIKGLTNLNTRIRGNYRGRFAWARSIFGQNKINL